MRQLWVTPEIAELLDGNRAGAIFGTVEGEAVVSRFISGQLIQVSRKNVPRTKRENRYIDVEQLEGEDEVWMLCVRIPRPGWRILGRLASKGTFVGLVAFDKHDEAKAYGGNVQQLYKDKAQETIKVWGALLGPYEPIRANMLEEYLGGVTRDVDEKDP